MRTVIFFGLLCIAESIGKFTGWKLNEVTGSVMLVILVLAILFDVIDFIRGLH
jgi:hypothetical protein